MKMVSKISLIMMVSFGVGASQYGPVVDSFVNELKTSGALSQMSACLDVPQNTILKTYKQGMHHCFDNYASDEKKLEQCFEQKITQSLSKLSPKFEMCATQFDEEDDSDELQSPEDFQQNYEKLANDLANALGQQSGDVSDITLPIYQGAKIKIHYPEGMVLNNKKTLPVATFMVNDTLENVISFYKKALPKFQMTKDSGIYRFAKKLPDNKLGLWEYAEQFSQMPHISVMEAVEQGSIVLEISYR